MKPKKLTDFLYEFVLYIYPEITQAHISNAVHNTHVFKVSTNKISLKKFLHKKKRKRIQFFLVIEISQT